MIALIAGGALVGGFIAVCGGIAAYFGIDPVIVRLLWVLFAFCGGAGVLAYIIAAFIMPLEV
jgi:phage shock protein C